MVHQITGLCPWLWWKFDSSVSEPGIFLSQLPYNERPQIQPRLEHPPSRCFQRANLLKVPPSIDAPDLDLTTDDQAEQQTLCCARIGQRTLGLHPAAKLPIEPLDGIGGTKRFPLAFRKTVEGQ